MHKHSHPIHAHSPAHEGQCGHPHHSPQTSCCSQSESSHCCDSSGVQSTEAGGQSCCGTTEHNHGENSDEEAAPRAGQRRFSWQVEGMDCPSCARKIENAVKALSGVGHAQVIFATEKLIVDAQFDVSQQVPQAIQKLGFTVQPVQGPVGQKTNPPHFFKDNAALLLLAGLMLLSWGVSFFSPRVGQVAFIATTCVGLWPILRQAWRQTRSGTPFAIETLMSVAAIGALFIGATEEAAMVLLLFMLGERLESYAAYRARRGVSALVELMPESAVVIREGKRITIAARELMPDEVIEVAPGARLPADAELLTAYASFDESALTGESLPVERAQGEKVAAGSLVVDRVSQLRVTSLPGQNAIDRILTMIEEAEERRAPIERFLDRFSRYYTPAIMLLALATLLLPPLLWNAAWETWIYRGLTLLLIGCPCALVISTPAAITSGLAAATRIGALIKGGAALEQLGTVRQIALDKTGTLTQGRPQVTDVITAKESHEQTVLSWASAVEAGSHHPLAQAIRQRAAEAGYLEEEATERRALPGIGVEGYIQGQHVLLSTPDKCPLLSVKGEWQQTISALENEGKTVVVVQVEQHIIGLIALRDTLRPEAKQTLSTLREMGIHGVMLTGDNTRAASAIAQALGIDFQASLLPEDKVRAVAQIAQNEVVAMVGDGINDAPAMKAAHIGIAMGSGTDVALETADAALTQDKLTGLVTMIQIARETRANIRQNITIALGLKAIFLVTSLLGMTGLWLAVLADSGATALVTANALRLLRKR